jgi:hypothetical protein
VRGDSRPEAVRETQLRRLPLCLAGFSVVKALDLVYSLLSTLYFLNKLSNAARASFGRKLAGVEVSFSRVTRISYKVQSFRASFFAIRSFTGCMHSNRLPGSKYVHCLHECNSNPHFGHCPVVVIPCSTVPHCVHREIARVPGRLTGLGPNVLSRFGGGDPDFSPNFSLDPLRSSRSRS